LDYFGLLDGRPLRGRHDAAVNEFLERDMRSGRSRMLKQGQEPHTTAVEPIAVFSIRMARAELMVVNRFHCWPLLARCKCSED